jgi:Tol biopolymer transport system component
MKISKTAIFVLTIALSGLFLFAGSAVQTDAPGVQLRAAIEKEEVEGDLQAAIEQYKKIVADSGDNRAVAAQALLRLGGCYEKLGHEDARKTYEQLLADYPEQQQEVAAARQRLAAITAPLPQENKSVSVRMLWKQSPAPLAAGIPLGEVSPDGRYISYVNDSDYVLAIRDLTTGQSRLLTGKGGWSWGSCWSPDGKRIAYGWEIEDQKGVEMPYELRITDPTGKDGTRVLYRSETYVNPIGWFPDGKSILAGVEGKGKWGRVIRISLDDDAVQLLQTEWSSAIRSTSGPGSVRLSPDGKYVAHDFLTTNSNSDIFLLPVSGGNEIPLVTGPYDDKLLAWTPDGRHMLFSSNRSGTYDAWLIRVENGKAAGMPELVKQDLGIVRPIGFAPGGGFYFGRVVAIHDILVADWNTEAGKPVSAPKMATEHFAGSTHWPEWSRDGKKLAYIVHRGALYSLADNQVRIRDLETGQESTVPRIGDRITSLSWSPDGKSLLLCGGPGGVKKFCRIVEVNSGKVLLEIAAQGEQAPTYAEWAPDGSAVYYATWVMDQGRGRIVKRALGSGKEEILYSLDQFHNPIEFTASPDGKFLAFALTLRRHRIMLLPTGQGDARELARIEWPNRLRGGMIAWSPDSRHVYFAESVPDKNTDRLLRISVSGGAPEQTQFESTGFSELRFSPDGRQIAFTQFGKNQGEVWVMENFMPK